MDENVERIIDFVRGKDDPWFDMWGGEHIACPICGKNMSHRCSTLLQARCYYHDGEMVDQDHDNEEVVEASWLCHKCELIIEFDSQEIVYKDTAKTVEEFFHPLTFVVLTGKPSPLLSHDSCECDESGA